MILLGAGTALTGALLGSVVFTDAQPSSGVINENVVLGAFLVFLTTFLLTAMAFAAQEKIDRTLELKESSEN